MRGEIPIFNQIAIPGLAVFLLVSLAGCDLLEPSVSIFDLAKQGNAEQVKAILTKDPSLANTRSEDSTYRGYSPLHFASTAEVVKALVAVGANVMAADSVGRTPLHLAGNAEVAQALIDAGAQVMAENPKGLTPLHLADNAGVAEVLLKHGARVHYRKAREKPALYWPILDNKPDVVEVLLKKGADTRELLSNKQTMLHHAAKYSRAEVIGVLLKNGFRVDPRADYGATPLHYAVLEDKMDSVKRLLQSRARLNAKLDEGVSINGRTDASGATPLGLASSEEMKEFLKGRGAK